jgi:hypothetical protein
MKIHFTRPSKLIRVNIKKKEHATEHIMFQECDLLECAQKLMDAAYDIVDQPEDKDESNKIIIQCREWVNSKNGASCSFPVYNVSPSMMKQLFLRHFGYGMEFDEQ